MATNGCVERSVRSPGLTRKKRGRGYHEINKDQLQRYFVKRLQRLGLTVNPQPAA